MTEELYQRDMTKEFNTKLSADDERKFQEWAYGNGRISDLWDYDLRGAWKELMSGTMTEDERGHLGDKYKKPNHPTFSTESIYADQVPQRAGEWGEAAGGTTVYKAKNRSKSEQAALKRYFRRREQGVILELENDQEQ